MGLCVETAREFRVDPAGNILSAYGVKWLLNNDVHERGFVIKLEFDSSIVCLWATNFSSVMKIKTLRKKIRRLETRLREGPKKLARLKRKLEAQVRADEAAARRKSAARVAAARRAARRTKVKRTLNLSPERRAQLADAMRARWAAKRAAAVPSPEEISANRDSTPEQGAEGPAGPVASWP